MNADEHGLDIELGYGRGVVGFRFDETRFRVIGAEIDDEAPLSDFEVGAAFDSVVADSDDSALILVSDATRATASAQIVNLLVRRLIQAGVSPANIAIIFATGIHRAVNDKE